MYSEDYERARAQERNTEDVYSKPVRAGKRTYFFDVKIILMTFFTGFVNKNAY